jgi:chromosome segregation ATPase
MTQSNDLPRRVNKLEDDVIDLKLAVSSLIEVVNRHQNNFETAQRNFEIMQRSIDARQRDIEANQRDIEANQRNIEVMVSEMQEMRQEIRGLQIENRRMLDYLLGQQDTNNEEG